MGGGFSSMLLSGGDPGKLLLHDDRSKQLRADILQILDKHPELKMYQGPACCASVASGLHIAAVASRADILEALLEGLDAELQHRSRAAAERTKYKVINQRDPHGSTALMLACKTGAVECVRLLLHVGARPTMFDGGQSTCLHIAARQGHALVIDALLGDDSYVLSKDGERVLLRKAVIVNPQGQHHKFIDGRSNQVLTPLHLAACHGHATATESLIRWEASLTVRCNVFQEDEQQGPWVPFSTPAHLAAAKGHAEVLLALLRGWARLPPQTRPTDLRRLRDFSGRRPVDVARSLGHTHLIPLLSTSRTVQQVIEPPPCPVPPLAALAAEAHRTQLLILLNQISAQQAQQAAVREASPPQAAPSQEPQLASPSRSEGGSRRSGRGGSQGGSCHGGGSSVRLGRSSGASSGQHCSTATSHCPICFCEDPHRFVVAVDPCGHAVCLPCAWQLCEALLRGGAPVRCPLCRGIVGAWEERDADQ